MATWQSAGDFLITVFSFYMWMMSHPKDTDIDQIGLYISRRIGQAKGDGYQNLGCLIVSLY